MSEKQWEKAAERANDWALSVTFAPGISAEAKRENVLTALVSALSYHGPFTSDEKQWICAAIEEAR